MDSAGCLLDRSTLSPQRSNQSDPSLCGLRCRELRWSFPSAIPGLAPVAPTVSFGSGIASLIVARMAVDPLFSSQAEGFVGLAGKIAPLSFFKYHDIFRFLLQRSVFVVALLHYLDTDILIPLPDAAKLLGGTAPFGTIDEGTRVRIWPYL